MTNITLGQMPRTVAKFGGGILPDANAMAKTARLARQNNYNVAVVSAFSGVTDKLIASSKEAMVGKFGSFEEMKSLHDGILRDATTDRMHNNVYLKLRKIQTDGIRSEERRAAIECSGEKICAYIFSAQSGFELKLPEEIGLGARGGFLEAVADGMRFNSNILGGGNYVVPGFYGIGGGKPKLFGRGGSDYSAAFIASQIGAGEVHYWKNVDGYMTADPRIVQGAKFREEMTFSEVEGLGYFGSKIIHPRAAEVLKGTDVVAWIKNFFAPENRGTRVAKEKNANGFSIAYKINIALVTIETAVMAEHAGFAARIFGILGKNNISVDGIGTSQTSISFTIDRKDSLAAGRLLSDAGYSPNIRENVSLIAVIGDSIRSSTSFLSRTFAAIEASGERNIELITKGRDMELSFVANSQNMNNIMVNLHEGLIGANPKMQEN